MISPTAEPPVVGVLLSGGLDSAILVGQLVAAGHTVQPCYVRCGLFWESAELGAAEKFLAAIRHERLRPLARFDLPVADVYGDHWSITGRGIPSADSPDDAVFLPGRNALLLSKVAVWCQLQQIGQLALAPLAGNPFGDASDEFFACFESMLGYLNPVRLQILRPFRQLNKKQVMQLGQNLPLGLTFSCINPRGLDHCGDCNKCTERRRAFRDAGLADPTVYAHPSPW